MNRFPGRALGTAVEVVVVVAEVAVSGGRRAAGRGVVGVEVVLVVVEDDARLHLDCDVIPIIASARGPITVAAFGDGPRRARRTSDRVW